MLLVSGLLLLYDKAPSDCYHSATLTQVANPQTYMVQAKCSKHYNQACFHYSSAISVSPQWSTMTCHIATNAHRGTRCPGFPFQFLHKLTVSSLDNGAMTDIWSKAHDGKGWQDKANRVEQNCGRDEYPPA